MTPKKRNAHFILTGVALTGFYIAYKKWKRRRVADLQANSRLVTTAKGLVEYAAYGEGTAVLILHGTPGGCDQGLALARLLNLSDVQFICVSRPGYLRTPLSVGRTPAEQADAMIALLDSLGIREAIVMGISGGGPTALEFALRHPKRCRGVVMVCAVSQREEPEKPVLRMRLMSFLVQMEFATNFSAILGALWPRGMVPLAVANPQHRAFVLDDAEKLSSLTDMLLSNSMFSLRQAGRTNDREQELALPDYPLERITAPTLVLHGTADINVPFAQAEFVANAVPDVKLKVFDEADHFFYLPFRETVVAEIEAFMEKIAYA